MTLLDGGGTGGTGSGGGGTTEVTILVGNTYYGSGAVPGKAGKAVALPRF